MSPAAHGLPPSRSSGARVRVISPHGSTSSLKNRVSAQFTGSEARMTSRARSESSPARRSSLSPHNSGTCSYTERRPSDIGMVPTLATTPALSRSAFSPWHSTRGSEARSTRAGRHQHGVARGPPRSAAGPRRARDRRDRPGADACPNLVTGSLDDCGAEASGARTPAIAAAGMGGTRPLRPLSITHPPDARRPQV